MGALLKSEKTSFVLALLVGGVFLAASWGKVQDPHAFAIAVRGYKIIPLSLSNLFALALAWSEIVVAVLLLVGFMRKKAAGAAFVMLTMFIVALAAVIARGMVVDCGCFESEGGSQTGPLLILRNVALAIACILIMRFDTGWGGLGALLNKRN